MAHMLESRRAEFLAHVEAGKTLSQICRLMGTKYTYTAVVTLAGKREHLGMFATPEAAHAAYVEAKRRLHPGCTL